MTRARNEPHPVTEGNDVIAPETPWDRGVGSGPRRAPLLRLREVEVAHDGHLALRGVDLALAEGEVLAVLGPSGCGKSTLLRGIAGLDPLRRGTVSFGGQDLTGVPVHRREFALMFQDGQLFAHLDVATNIAYPLKLRRTPSAERRSRVTELLALVGLTGYEHRMPQTLSGGERQRVALARALAARPRLLLLDEPLSALDATLREHLAGELRDILRAAGTTAILVTHDHEEAFAVADTLAVMRAGEIVQHGPVADVWARPVDAWTAAFLGYAHVVTGPGASTLLTAAGLTPGPAVALRRSALVVDPTGGVRGTVRSARATPDGIRLVLELPDLVGADGEPVVVDAVAETAADHGPGAHVRVRVEPSRLAPLRTVQT